MKKTQTFRQYLGGEIHVVSIKSGEEIQLDSADGTTIVFSRHGSQIIRERFPANGPKERAIFTGLQEFEGEFFGMWRTVKAHGRVD